MVEENEHADKEGRPNLINRDAVRKRQAARGFICKRLSEKQSLRNFVTKLANGYATQKITNVAAPEAMGFALAGAAAERLQCGLILITKWAPEDREGYDSQSFVDYSGLTKTLYLRRTPLGAVTWCS